MRGSLRDNANPFLLTRHFKKLFELSDTDLSQKDLARYSRVINKFSDQIQNLDPSDMSSYKNMMLAFINNLLIKLISKTSEENADKKIITDLRSNAIVFLYEAKISDGSVELYYDSTLLNSELPIFLSIEEGLKMLSDNVAQNIENKIILK